MALAPKKTYSKRENGLLDISVREKENVDPFDELLASPLKQDVQFQPLGFWGKKVRDFESKRKKEVKCELYEASEPDGHSSLWKKSKTRTLQTKSKISKLSDTRKARSTNCSNTKHQVLPSERVTLKSTKDILKNKGYLPKKSILKLSCKNSDSFEYKNKSSIGWNSVNCNEKFKETFCSVNFKSNDENVNATKLEYKIFEDNISAELLGSTNKSIIHKQNEDLVNRTVYFNDNMEETFVPLSEGCDKFKYVTVKRDFNLPKFLSDGGSLSSSPSLVTSSRSIKSPIWLWSKQKKISLISPCVPEDEATEADLSGNISDTINGSLDHCKSIDESLCPEEVASQTESEESVTMVESSGGRLSDDSDFIYSSDSELKDIKELLEQESVDTTAEKSSTSDDTFSEGETVIKISPGPAKVTSPADSQVEDKADHSGSSPNRVSFLTSGISGLSITRVGEDGALTNHGTERLDNTVNSFSVELKNVTTRRGGFLTAKNEKGGTVDRRCRADPDDNQVDFEIDQTFELPGITSRISLDWNKTVSLGNPAFESTRVYDAVHGDTDNETPQKQSKGFEEMSSILEDTPSLLDHTYALKPGKQWIRSLSVLKQIQNGNLTGGTLESTRITGRKFESFVKDLLKMQNEKSNFFTTAANVRSSESQSVRSKFLDGLSSDETILERGSSRDNESEELYDSVLSKTISHKTVLGKSLFNHTVRVIQSEDNSSAFRSALGLDSSNFLIGDGDGTLERSSDNAKNFILNECGQEDILPFEEFFNEKTLPNCKKIGEGVYGEVFMCSDTVIKIIPIEGSQQVNGAPQKTFEEIISEVVISSKLSNLRDGNHNRTEGFSEMKRCWCVKGKYPEYLLKLWNAYDQSGSGSENDSPVMFKEDQLYIILELANGGKDLESFVFSSSLQTLSVFIQTAFSLAVAEKAFQFEHRDLHWGNVLISKTNEKFMCVTLDGIEYKIPTKGVKVCIIDFTLSRINHEECCIFNDLALDPELFTAQGDYQFEIYRMMQRELRNDWSLFNPKTNIFWLHYTVDKMIKMVRYRIRNSKVHSKYMKHLKSLESVILGHKNSTSFVLSKSLTDMLIKL